MADADKSKRSFLQPYDRLLGALPSHLRFLSFSDSANALPSSATHYQSLPGQEEYQLAGLELGQLHVESLRIVVECLRPRLDRLTYLGFTVTDESERVFVDVLEHLPSIKALEVTHPTQWVIRRVAELFATQLEHLGLIRHDRAVDGWEEIRLVAKILLLSRLRSLSIRLAYTCYKNRWGWLAELAERHGRLEYVYVDKLAGEIPVSVLQTVVESCPVCIYQCYHRLGARLSDSCVICRNCAT